MTDKHENLNNKPTTQPMFIPGPRVKETKIFGEEI